MLEYWNDGRMGQRRRQKTVDRIQKKPPITKTRKNPSTEVRTGGETKEEGVGVISRLGSLGALTLFQHSIIPVFQYPIITVPLL
jgi:hypothetical protein